MTATMPSTLNSVLVSLISAMVMGPFDELNGLLICNEPNAKRGTTV